MLTGTDWNWAQVLMISPFAWDKSPREARITIKARVKTLSPSGGNTCFIEADRSSLIILVPWPFLAGSMADFPVRPLSIDLVALEYIYLEFAKVYLI
jgi:hypothetical protein